MEEETILTIKELIMIAREARASDIHLTADRNPVFRIDGELHETEFSLSSSEKISLIRSMLDRDRKSVV